MTPAVTELERAGVDFVTLSYERDESQTGPGAGYGIEAAAKTGLDPDQVFKTLLVAYAGDDGRDQHAVGIVPVSTMLSLKGIGGALGVKRLSMCDPAVAERVTGYVVGGISPFGQRKRLATVIDETAFVFDRIYVSGGQRGFEIGIAPADLVAVLHAVVADIAA